jgi:type I restriction enzyme, S subunit
MTNARKVLTSTEKCITQLGLSNSSARMFKKGTLLYAMYASIGECSIAGIDCSCNQAILGIVPHSIDAEFLYYYLTFNRERIKTEGQTGTQSNLNKRIVQSLIILSPPITEQEAVAQVLSAMDAEIDELETERKKLTQFKQGMMQELLTGRVRLR